MMYTIIAICDSITGLVTFVHASILFALDFNAVKIRDTDSTADFDMKMEWLICINFVLTTITLRSSLFFNVVLVIIRTINITRPFTLIRKRAVLACICIYPIILATVALADVIVYSEMVGATGMSKAFEKFELLCYCFFFPIPNYQVGGALYYHYLETLPNIEVILNCLVALTVFITLALPAVISVICSVIQVVYLLKKNAAASNNAMLREAVQRQMTVTILLLMAVCLICNLPYTFYNIISVLIVRIYPSMDVFYVTYFMSTLVPFMNAAISPFLLILRGKALRMFIWQKAEVFKKSFLYFFNCRS